MSVTATKPEAPPGRRARLVALVAFALLASVAPISLAAPSAGAASTADGPITRSEVLQRSRSWIDEQVMYSQTQYHTNQFGTYRQDCSGFVSMSWHLGTSYTTASLPSLMHQIAWSDLRPGDALWRRGGSPYVHHIALFIGWVDASTKAQPIVREEHATGTPAVERPWSNGWASTFTPMRYNRIVEDAPPPPPPPVIPPSKTAPLSAGQDFNGDGHDDVFFYGTGSGPENVWLGTGTPGSFTKYEATPIGGNYTPVAGDFNGDGKSEIFWYSPGADSDWIWYWYGAGPDNLFVYDAPRNTAGQALNVTGGYQPVSGDFDADGKDDIFWYSLTGGTDYVWYGGTNGFTDVRTTQVSRAGLTPIAGDYDSDGRTDIYWYGPGNLTDTLWRGSATRTFLPISTQQVTGSYSPIAGDFNADGKDDLYWYAVGGNNDTLWLSQGGGRFTSNSTNDAGGFYWIIGGNFNGDKVNGHNRDDIMWYAPGTVGDNLWTNTGSASFSSLPLTINGSYTPI